MLQKKDKGMLDQILPTIMIIVFIAVLWTGSVFCASAIDKSSEIKELARTYLLKMETDGYLTEENKNSLLAELALLEVSEVDLSGTTITDAGYGNLIRLHIKGNVMLTRVRFKGFATPMLVTGKTEVSVNKVSVAKD